MSDATRRSGLTGAGIGALLVATTAMAASAEAKTSPHIYAHPVSVMVNHAVSLHGVGFAANTVVHLTECSRTNWIAPQQFCSTSNTRAVRANREGAFVTTFVMDLCPKSKPVTKPVTARTCYVGEVTATGVDTLELLGAAKITVTYP